MIRLTILSNTDLVREDVSKTYVHNLILVKYIDKLRTEIANSCPRKGASVECASIIGHNIVIVTLVVSVRI